MTSKEYEAIAYKPPVFGKVWFANHQGSFLWVLNTVVVRWLARWVLRIRRCEIPIRTKITGIGPNWYSFGDKELSDGRIERSLCARSNNKYSLRLFHAFRPLWWICHQWDSFLAEPLYPALDLGFSTYTAYSDESSPGTTTCSGYAYHDNSGTSAVWATLHDASISTHGGTNVGPDAWAYITCDSTTSKYAGFQRAFLTCDTSAITSGANISAVTVGIFSQDAAADANFTSASINVFSSTQGDAHIVMGADYSKCGTTPLSTAVGQAAWHSAMGSYVTFALNSTGIAGISKTGISKLSFREATFDAPNTPPTWGNSQGVDIEGDFANYTGRTHDPYILITYTTGGGTLYTNTAAETITISESDTAIRKLKPTVAETITISESDTAIRKLKPTVAETVTISESDAAISKLKPTASETITISESDTAIRKLKPTVAETITISEATTGTKRYVSTPSETVTISESDVAVAKLKPTAAETITISDSNTSKAFLHTTAAESFAINESSLSVKKARPAIAETVTITEGLAAMAKHRTALATTMTISETVAAVNKCHASIAESMAIIDAVTSSLIHAAAQMCAIFMAGD